MPLKSLIIKILKGDIMRTAKTATTSGAPQHAHQIAAATATEAGEKMSTK